MMSFWRKFEVPNQYELKEKLTKKAEWMTGFFNDFCKTKQRLERESSLGKDATNEAIEVYKRCHELLKRLPEDFGSATHLGDWDFFAKSTRYKAALEAVSGGALPCHNHDGLAGPVKSRAKGGPGSAAAAAAAPCPMCALSSQLDVFSKDFNTFLYVIGVPVDYNFRGVSLGYLDDPNRSTHFELMLSEEADANLGNLEKTIKASMKRPGGAILFRFRVQLVNEKGPTELMVTEWSERASVKLAAVQVGDQLRKEGHWDLLMGSQGLGKGIDGIDDDGDDDDGDSNGLKAYLLLSAELRLGGCTGEVMCRTVGVHALHLDFLRYPQKVVAAEQKRNEEQRERERRDKERAKEEARESQARAQAKAEAEAKAAKAERDRLQKAQDAERAAREKKERLAKAEGFRDELVALVAGRDPATGLTYEMTKRAKELADLLNSTEFACEGGDAAVAQARALLAQATTKKPQASDAKAVKKAERLLEEVMGSGDAGRLQDAISIARAAGVDASAAEQELEGISLKDQVDEALAMDNKDPAKLPTLLTLIELYSNTGRKIPTKAAAAAESLAAEAAFADSLAAEEPAKPAQAPAKQQQQQQKQAPPKQAPAMQAPATKGSSSSSSSSSSVPPQQQQQPQQPQQQPQQQQPSKKGQKQPEAKKEQVPKPEQEPPQAKSAGSTPSTSAAATPAAVAPLDLQDYVCSLCYGSNPGSALRCSACSHIRDDPNCDCLTCTDERGASAPAVAAPPKQEKQQPQQAAAEPASSSSSSSKFHKNLKPNEALELLKSTASTAAPGQRALSTLFTAFPFYSPPPPRFQRPTPANEDPEDKLYRTEQEHEATLRWAKGLVQAMRSHKQQQQVEDKKQQPVKVVEEEEQTNQIACRRCTVFNDINATVCYVCTNDPR